MVHLFTCHGRIMPHLAELLFGPVPGANVILEPYENELDFFLLFFLAFLFEIMVSQTNLYARQR